MGASGTFGARLKAFREAAGFTQQELATIAGLSVHAISALERGERRRPQPETVRALSAALDLDGIVRDSLMESARAGDQDPVDKPRDTPLPLAPTELVGREHDLDVLQAWLDDPAVRLITLTGAGGAGKTRLALELARRLSGDAGQRVVYVPLAAVHESALVAPAIAESLGLSDVAASELTRCVRSACDDQPTWLALDNFEQVLPAATIVSDLLAHVTPLRVLVTSRAPLRIRGEREYPVGPLDLDPDETLVSIAELARIPAVRLFLERARDVQPEFRLTSTNRGAVVAICRRLDALPLALELAAPWVKVLPIDELLRRLGDNALLAGAGARDLPERQQTMNATVAWSYRLLSPAEQRLFRRLGVLPGKFSIAAASAVLAGDADAAPADDEVVRTAAALIDKSLLLRAESSAPSRPLYEMLETVRAFAGREASAHRERDSALAGLSRYCTAEARAAANGLVGPAQGEWLDRVRDDLENHRAVFGWLIECGRAADAAELAFQLFFFWVIRGHAPQGLDWYERALAAGPLPASIEAMARLGAGGMRYTLGDITRARSALATGLAIAEPVDLLIRSWTQLLAGHVEHAIGDDRRAHELFTRSLEGFRRVGFAWGIGNSLEGLAWVALADGELEAAERVLEEARAALRECGPWALLLMLYVQAAVAVRRNKPDEAIEYIRLSLLHIRDLDDKFAFVYAIVPLAVACVQKGDDLWAARVLGARDAVSERTGATAIDRSLSGLKEDAERTARERLGVDAWARAYGAGRRASIQSLIADFDR